MVRRSGHGKEKIAHCDTLFAEVVLAKELPPYFRSLQIGEYNGSSDSEEHLGRFENAALLH